MGLLKDLEALQKRPRDNVALEEPICYSTNKPHILVENQTVDTVNHYHSPSNPSLRTEPGREQC
jgi:hypothetical protein